MTCSPKRNLAAMAIAFALVAIVTVRSAAPDGESALTVVPTVASTVTSTITSTVTSTIASSWLSAQPDFQWHFPRDHWSHPGFKVEWWYFTGQVESDDDATQRFGFQLTFFRVGLLPEAPALDSQWATSDLVMGHAAITDLKAGEHVFSEVLYRAVPLLGGFGTFPDTLLAWSRAPAGTDAEWQLSYVDGRFALRARDDQRGLALDLVLRPAHPVIFQGPGGYSRKSAQQQGSGGDAAASMYFSYPRLSVTGTLGRSDASLHKVTGTAWMDHEFSTSQLGAEQMGWDWFSLQLDDGRDLMIYRMRRRDGGVDFALGTLVAADRSVRYLKESDFSLQPRRSWRSEKTEAEYPVEWDLEVPAEGIRLRVSALLDAQENVNQRSGVHYWEGAVKAKGVGGSPGGRGYVELTGYGEGSRPPI